MKSAIFGHAEFTAFQQSVIQVFDAWKHANTPRMKGFDKAGYPKTLIETLAEDLLATFKAVPLLDAYAAYQHLMDYWRRRCRTIVISSLLMVGWQKRTGFWRQTKRAGRKIRAGPAI